MERFTIRNSEGIAVYKHPYMCERCGENFWRLPDLGDGSPTEKLAAYEDLQDRLDRQFNGHVSMAMIIGAIIEYDKQSGRDEALADAMLITNENVHKYREWKSLEGQGRLLKLPCMIGDTVYVKLQLGGYAEAEVRDYIYFLSCGFCIVVTSKSFNKQNIPFSEFGKTVFVTKKEVETALKGYEHTENHKQKA